MSDEGRDALLARRRAWAAVVLAADKDAVEGLLTGQEVPRRRLMPEVLTAIDEPQDGPPVVLTDALALRVELRSREEPSPAEERPTGAVSVFEFVKRELPGAEALLGTPQHPIIPARGVVLLTGKPGAGKTLATVHLCISEPAGREWLGYPTARPLRVGFVENEGSQAEFQRLLGEHIEALGAQAFPEPGAILLPEWPWGELRIDVPERHAWLRQWVADHAIDLLVADPLKLFGARGAGSPDDTAEFLRLLRGLDAGVAFMLLHHHAHGSTRGGKPANAGDEVSGAWPSHADTHMILTPLASNRMRLSFPKLRLHTLPPALIIEHASPGIRLVSVANAATSEERVLQALAEGPATYDELEGRTDLSHRTLEGLIPRLIKTGTLMEVAPDETAGRPRKRFSLTRQLTLVEDAA